MVVALVAVNTLPNNTKSSPLEATTTSGDFVAPGNSPRLIGKLVVVILAMNIVIIGSLHLHISPHKLSFLPSDLKMFSDIPASNTVTLPCGTVLPRAPQSQYRNAETSMEQWLNCTMDQIIGLSAMPIEKPTNTLADTPGSVGMDSTETVIGSQYGGAEYRMKQWQDCTMDRIMGLSAIPKEEPTNTNVAAETKTGSEKTGPSGSMTREKVNGVPGFRATALSTAENDSE
ncbi:hypothetical protein BDD12DRAFT_806271 [Trichophaea hybrida]|nr:hypothetical protein BDD12DRAFT_806271 [Trichophaea hybrida]